MNDELTTQTSPPPIVLKLKKYDDHHPSILLPHASRSSTDSLDEGSSSSILTSPSSLRVKLKKSLLNGTNDYSDDEHTNSILSDRPAKRSKKASSIDNSITNSDFNNDQISSQRLNEIKSEHSSLVLKLRRDSATTTVSANTSGTSTVIEPETNRQLLLKLKKNEHGELITTTDSMSTSSSHFLVTEQQQPPPPPPSEMTMTNNSTAYFSNGHDDTLYQPMHSNNNTTPHITNMLSNFPEQRTNIYPQTTTVSHIPMEVTPAAAASAASSAAETHTKELLDEALDSVKNVLMQTFKKNLETGGDLNALKSTLGSDEVAEVFLAKLRQSLKRDTENEQKLTEIHMDTDIRSSSSNAMISPVVNVASVVSSPSSSPLLPPMSSMLGMPAKNDTTIGICCRSTSSSSCCFAPTTPTDFDE